MLVSWTGIMMCIPNIASWTLLIFQQKHQSYICKNGPFCLVMTLSGVYPVFAVSKVTDKTQPQNAVFSGEKWLRKTYGST